MLKQLSTLAAGLLVSLAAWAVPTVEMTTSLGKMTIELNAEKAPKTVEMFPTTPSTASTTARSSTASFRTS